MKTVMLFGGAGFIGKNIAKTLLKLNFKVVIFDRSNPEIEHERLVYVNGSLGDLDALRDALKEHSVLEFVYLVNNIPVNAGGVNIDDLLEINKKSIEVIYQYVDRLVFFSSGGRVYGQGSLAHSEEDALNPICAYGTSKVILEEFILDLSAKNNKKTLILRPSNPYGPYQNIYGSQGLISIILGNIIAGKEIEIWGSGDEVRDYIYIDDLCLMFLNLFLAEELPHHIYNIGSGRGCSTNQIVDICVALNDSFKPNIVHKEATNLVRKNILDIGRYTSIFSEPEFIPIDRGIKKYYHFLLRMKI